MRVVPLLMRSGFGRSMRISRLLPFPLRLVRAVSNIALFLGIFVGVLNSSQALASDGSYLDRDDVTDWVKETVAETDLNIEYVRSQLALATRQETVSYTHLTLPTIYSV